MIIEKIKEKTSKKLRREYIFSILAIAIIILGYLLLKPSTTGFYIHKSQPINGINITTASASVNLDIPSEYRIIADGEDLKVQITLFTIGNLNEVNISLNYFIKSVNGAIILEEMASLAIDKQVSYIKVFNTKNLLPGEYVAGVEAVSKDSIVVSSKMFKIGSFIPLKLSPANESLLNKYFSVISITFEVLVIIFMIIVVRKIIKLIKKNINKESKVKKDINDKN